jgi:hypothetical protein|tara:strand:- start:298 stop:453 length:156 start_codon:yes stop_codon:yes gene_type:complete
MFWPEKRSERTGTYVGDDADDSADEDSEEMPRLRGNALGGGNAPDDETGED